MTGATQPRKRLASDDVMANLSTSFDAFRRRISGLASPDATTTNPGSPMTTVPPPQLPEAVSECSVCLCSLGLLKFKYVCKNCDKTVCGAHSKNQIPLPDMGVWKEVRVCDVCYEQRLKRRAGAIETSDDAPGDDDTSLCGILFSGLVEEQDDTLDEMLYLGSFRMGSRSLASRNFNPNMAIWIERMVMLTPAELLSFKPQKDKDKEEFLLGIGEVRSSIHMTDILHIDVDEHYPRILTLVRSDGRIYRLRAKDIETCAAITKKLQEAMHLFQAALHKLQRGLRPEDNVVACVTVQHHPSLDEIVVRAGTGPDDSTPSRPQFLLELYPASVVRLYASSPVVSAVATYTVPELFQQVKRCDTVRGATSTDEHQLVTHVDIGEISHYGWLGVGLAAIGGGSGVVMLMSAQSPPALPLLLLPPLHSLLPWLVVALMALTLSFAKHLNVMVRTWQLWGPQTFRLVCVKVDCIKNTLPPHAKDLTVDLRFTEACKGDADEAKRKYSKYLEWRHDHNIDTILLRPHPNFKVESYPQVTHKRDKLGHLVAFELAGGMRKGMQYFQSKGVTEEDVVTHLGFYNEFLWTVLDRRPFPDGVMVKVIDMQGVTMGDFGGDVVNFMKKCSIVGEAYYPERLYKIFIVNPPSWFSMVWKAVSPLVNPKTRDKIHVVRGQKEIQKALLEFIDAASLPEAYGGTCACPGGCLANSDDEILLREYVAKMNAPAGSVDLAAELAVLQGVKVPPTPVPTTKRS
ncbi:hypothetical protein DYB28_001037 [Aphanomyces astaci]|uniref:CRAL-TRIO domain-containing protein n=1 Tax=Aphanomyces astaci TaxID=112090 RepID=A0A397APT7_APHAT|nr:hypothetical protein DYB25_001775 [Aphanomyces astaci]RHY07637.1 hypothetical protein DYB36_002657 [Aphanomyces astaci]RHY63621.1 hypothetical protein DYB34_001552 [Aphanomyces astaci]RHZ23437.1 hypothetical protein DYB31_000935 [Aphanomyces astaci]RLO08010.1 hypothetical protein DYB28_001037 [Aphanomyces astaci]